VALKMMVSIEFFGMQQSVTRTDRIDMTVPEKATVADVLAEVRRRYPELRLDEKKVLITVNQEMASPDTVLKANDTVSFLPSIGGG
jgi:molybdopterin converting factor small subunit